MARSETRELAEEAHHSKVASLSQRCAVMAGTRAPTLSVVVPAHNAASTIERCLAGLTAQDASRGEVLVVDDGSTDATGERVRGFAGVTLLRQDRRGSCAARNVGLAASVGRYVAFLDADDEVAPDWLSEFANALEGNREPLAATCGVRLIETTRLDRSHHRDRHPSGLGPAFANWRAVFLPGSYAVERRVLVELGGFAEDLHYGEHSELALRLAGWAEQHGGDVVAIERVLVTKHHDRTPMRVASYDESRRQGAEYQLEYHAERIRRDPRLAASYHAVAGVACMRLGLWREGRRHLRNAARLRASPKHLVRLAAAMVPPLASWRWSAPSGAR